MTKDKFMLGLGLGLNRARRGGGAGAVGILDAYKGAAFAFAPDTLIYSGFSVTDNTAGSNTNSDSGEFTVLVRRDSDNALQSFTWEEVSDGTLVTWVGVGNNGFVQVGYDQSGNNNPFVQTTASRQPRIVNNGVLETENGKAVLRPVNTTCGMLSLYNPNSGNATKTMFMVVKRNSISILQCIFGSEDSSLGSPDYGYLINLNSTLTLVNNFPTVTSENINGTSWVYSNRGDIYDDLVSQSLISNNIVFNFVDNVLGIGYRQEDMAGIEMTEVQFFVVIADDVAQSPIETAINNEYNIY